MLLYRIIISGYFFILKLAAFFSPKARLWVQGRKNIQPYLQQNMGKEEVIWFHCASLGEFEQGRPLMEKMRKDFPKIKILLTFFSPSGYEIRKKYDVVDYVCYLPEDKPKAINAFLTQVHPRMVVFVKYEYWFLLLQALITRGIPIYFVSATVKNGHYLTKWYAGSFRKILKKVNHFFVQDDFSRKQFVKMGIHQVTVAGDTRVDRVAELAQNVKDYPTIKDWAKNHQILICGSTWENDEDVILPYFKKIINNGWRIIIAPHDVSTNNIARLNQSLEIPFLKMTRLLPDNEPVINIDKFDIILVDTIGHLNSLYQFGVICYIGGGFNKTGIHNTLEPATFGLPLIFGPNYSKFMEAKAFVEQKGAYSIGQWNRKKSISSLEQCQQEFEQLMGELQSKKVASVASLVTKGYIQNHKGASENILQTLYRHL